MKVQERGDECLKILIKFFLFTVINNIKNSNVIKNIVTRKYFAYEKVCLTHLRVFYAHPIHTIIKYNSKYIYIRTYTANINI